MGSTSSAQLPESNSNSMDMANPTSPAVFDGSSWTDNFLDDAMNRALTDGVNGLFHSFDDKGEFSSVVPEEMMEVILSYCDINDILNIARVCIRWKTITTSRSFWKPVCTQHNISWAEIPTSIKENPNAWVAFHAFCKHDILKKNFVRNHSGQDGFNGWDTETSVYAHHNPPFQIEQVPIGCDRLPDDPSFDTTSCLATSFNYGRKSQIIDLWRAGLTPAVMRICAPFEITFTEMVGTRFDCGGTGVMSLEFEEFEPSENDAPDGEEDTPNPISTRTKAFTLPPGNDWVTFQITTPRLEADLLQTSNIRHVVVSSAGKDDRYWAGYYGIKFARCCLTFKCLDLEAM